MVNIFYKKVKISFNEVSYGNRWDGIGVNDL